MCAEREMGSRDKDHKAPHQPLLSSLVVRPSDSGGGGGGGGAGAGSDYEPGEVRRDAPPFSRSDRHDGHAVNIAWCKNLGLEEGMLELVSFLFLVFKMNVVWACYAINDQGDVLNGGWVLGQLTADLKVVRFTGKSENPDGNEGYRMRAGSVSPVRRRDAHHRFSPGFEHSDGARSRGFGNGRDTGRYRDYSPPYGHGKDGGRFSGRDFDRSARGPGPLRVEGLPRNNPNVRPREGDWICSDPSFTFLKSASLSSSQHILLAICMQAAFEDACRSTSSDIFLAMPCVSLSARYASSGSPRRGHPGPPPFPPRQRVPAAPLDHSPGRIMNGGFRSPPRGWPRDAPRDFRAAGPPARHEGRFPDPLVRSDRQDYPEDDPRDRYRYDRPMLPDWGHRDRGRDNYFNERRGYGRRPLSPPPAPAVLPRGWASNIRDRSRSPVRGGAQPRDYQRDIYMNRRRDDRRGVGRGAF
ncbi:UNVERIFIED_CONTAM: hypothetical protein Slati_2877400 [Sesamum latifolium]|uniref:Uncharacterized protein n=1 Tax=Sesamum latifolium TaxID=2727402 RepID=A0AAW2VC70_9LAMI